MPDAIDGPINVVQVIIRSILKLFRIHEPRAEIVNVEFEGNALNGQLNSLLGRRN
ncbi:hypothetical protein KHA80_14475 [Anaerobacillus sp. HL2]|nr:hypothetical protein KHA80_14475 [Anaerobacillus sp. HL2]